MTGKHCTSNRCIRNLGPMASRYGRSCCSETSPPRAPASAESRFRLCNRDSGWWARRGLAFIFQPTVASRHSLQMSQLGERDGLLSAPPMASIYSPERFSASSSLHEQPSRAHRSCKFPNQPGWRISNRNRRAYTGTFAYGASSRPKRADCSLDSRGHIVNGGSSVVSCQAAVQRQNAPKHNSESGGAQSDSTDKQCKYSRHPRVGAAASAARRSGSIGRQRCRQENLTAGWRTPEPPSLRQRLGVIHYVDPAAIHFIRRRVASP